ncbi:thioesterase family protein [Nocardioides sp.]|uniref:acyl-CoA thioesterase n=1 Tax=Nocardioides sp. TaxID=35761 RepID=UPI002734E857|nr:hotdog domain-containing protein [Nocardioides sp.]MDP3892669.1 hotdog domain-containing protein [Nocardioides sp.]
MTDVAPPVGVVHARVEWIDTDASGIYHNSTVTRFVEAAEARLMAERGLAGYFPSAPRVRYEADFDAPLLFGQDVTAMVTLAHVGTTSMRWEFEIWGEEFAGRPRVRAARGSYVTVHVGADHDPSAGTPRSRPWPEEWVTALSAGRP